jgi:membrane-bound metal-dependent hydrolase YbcI (DUF457 family)
MRSATMVALHILGVGLVIFMGKTCWVLLTPWSTKDYRFLLLDIPFDHFFVQILFILLWLVFSIIDILIMTHLF